MYRDRQTEIETESMRFYNVEYTVCLIIFKYHIGDNIYFIHYWLLSLLKKVL